MRELMVAQAQSVQSLAERDSLRADLDDYNSKWNSLTEEFENLFAENERSEKEYERRIAEEKQAFDLIRKKLEDEVSQERKKAYDAEKNYRKAHSEMTNKNSQIAFLTLENATLKHDLEQSKQTCSKYLEENTKLKSELGRISRKDGALYEKFTEKRAQIMQTISGFKDALEKVSSDEESNQADELKSCKEKLKRQNELCKRLMYRLDKMRRKIRKKNKNRKMRSSSRSSSSSVAEHSGSSQR
uniref:Uncharacterized protein n=1 Tax=Romanomermis culicivorax TaxID=13658 RepID=A0A915J4T4_ROMCU